MKKKIKIYIYLFYVIGSMFMLCIHCKQVDPITIAKPITVTVPIKYIRDSSAVSGCMITSNFDTKITASGICWSTGKKPTTLDYKTIDVFGDFAGSKMTGLNPITKYYVRAYCINATDTVYGDTISFTTLGNVIDVDRNVYLTVPISSQIWMAENLKVNHYRNGNPIPLITDNSLWNNTITGANCDYDNNPDSSISYGKLYNWYAVNSMNLCPIGWHVPTDLEWTDLANYLGGENVAGGKLKTPDIYWGDWIIREDAIEILLAGYRSENGTFSNNDFIGYWWTNTEFNPTSASFRKISYNDDILASESFNKNSGLSIRCVKD